MVGEANGRGRWAVPQNRLVALLYRLADLARGLGPYDFDFDLVQYIISKKKKSTLLNTSVMNEYLTACSLC